MPLRRHVLSLALLGLLLPTARGFATLHPAMTPNDASPVAWPTPPACPVTLVVTERPADPTAASFSATWYRSADGRIWASPGGPRLYAGRNKVLWAKPAESQLRVAGRRLDGDAPALAADVSGGYPGGFQASGLDFPTPGCWELEAETAGSRFRAVVDVYPRAYRPPTASCIDLPDAVRNSAAIVVGTAEGSAPDRQPGFAWQTVRLEAVWKGAVAAGERLDVLADTVSEAPLRAGRAYLLFLAAAPGVPWRTLCPQRTLAEVDGQQLVRPTPTQPGAPLWAAMTLAEIETQVRAVESLPAATPAP